MLIQNGTHSGQKPRRRAVSSLARRIRSGVTPVTGIREGDATPRAVDILPKGFFCAIALLVSLNS